MAGSVDMRPKLVVVANYGSTENRPPYVSDGRDEGKRSSGPGASKPSEEMLRSTLIPDRSQSSAGAARQIHQTRHGDVHDWDVVVIVRGDDASNEQMKNKFDEFRREELPSVTLIEASTSTRTCIKLCESASPGQ